MRLVAVCEWGRSVDAGEVPGGDLRDEVEESVRVQLDTDFLCDYDSRPLTRPSSPSR